MCLVSYHFKQKRKNLLGCVLSFWKRIVQRFLTSGSVPPFCICDEQAASIKQHLPNSSTFSEFIRCGQPRSSHIVWPITLDIKVREDNEGLDDDVGERTWLRRRSFVTSMYMKWWYSKLTPRCSQRQWGWFSGWCVAGGWCRIDLRQACTTNIDE